MTKKLAQKMSYGMKALLSSLSFILLLAPAVSAGTAYVTNFGSNTVAVLDTKTNTIINQIDVGSKPIDAAVTPDQKHVLIGHWGSGDIYVINASTQAVEKVIPVGNILGQIKVLPDGSKAYVADFGANGVGVIDLGTFQLLKTISTGQCPGYLSVSPDGREVYSSNHCSGTVSIIDTASDTVTANLPDVTCSTGVATSADGRKLYVAANCWYLVHVFDAQDLSYIKSIQVEIYPEMAERSTDGRYLFVPNRGSSSMSIIDTATDTVRATIPVGIGPIKGVDTPDGAFAYVTNSESNSLTVVDLSSMTVVNTIGGFSQPFGLAMSAEVSPVALCQSVTVNAGPACTATASIDNGYHALNEDPVILAQSPAGPYPLGNTLVTLTVTDRKGSAAQCTGTVTVLDNTPPTIHRVPDPVVVEQTSPLGATVSLPFPRATDKCGAADITSDAPAQFPAGTTTVTFRATDAAGNVATATTTVTVRDTIRPRLRCPADLTVQATSDTSALVSYQPATATDAASTPTVTYSISSGSAFPVGKTPVNVTARDAAGNVSQCTFNVTVLAPPVPAAGRMVGAGGIDQNGKRQQFEFQIRERATGQDSGRLEYWGRDTRAGLDRDDDGDDDPHQWTGKVDWFLSTAITDVVFSDDPRIRPARTPQPTVDTVQFRGRGLWNGKPGYTFQAKATDAGEPGKGRDTFSLTIQDANGNSVASVSGILARGNIQSSRIGSGR